MVEQNAVARNGAGGEALTPTINETIDELRQTLSQYIEATYHVGHPAMVNQRRSLLSEQGGIFQIPYLESTPRYVSAPPYAKINDLPAAALEALRTLSDSSNGKPVIFGSPYTHQYRALVEILNRGRNLMIMTGTGSGKTESFLLPILGKLAIEARERPKSFSHHAVRALVLYPMNALVNDQLGRLRTMFGDPRTVGLFEKWGGRPALFARYTSRTPYAGVRTGGKDGNRLGSFGDFFAAIEDGKTRVEQGAGNGDQDDRAAALFDELKKRGKWPAKQSVSEWFGTPGGNWKKRANRLPHDAELLTRHEAHVAPPDLLITNYSMLEYMMMRPIERTIFDATREWLKEFPSEKFIVVLDEAHLYRGAQGAEVGLLLRRLRERLGITADRLQVICSTASFSEKGKENAGEFGAQLTGVDPSTFTSIKGELAFRSPESVGTKADATALASVDLTKFYSEEETDQADSISAFLKFRKIAPAQTVESSLYNALKEFGPLNLLVNRTMQAALSLAELPSLVFAADTPDELKDTALSILLALGSRAREKAGDASLLPCRIHSFFRGLPGLWVCMDQGCPDAPEGHDGPAGRMFSQPRDRCSCGAPVLEYFTCRDCGASYARAYTNDVSNPRYLWPFEGEKLDTPAGPVSALHPLDLLLETPPEADRAKDADYDLVSGQLNPDKPSPKQRPVYLNIPKPQPPGTQGPVRGAQPGQFTPCACCQQEAGYGQSSVQDHQTKGDQPFQSILASQIRIQPPGPQKQSAFAPLRGRKVLIFSDSRQVAARLSGTLQNYSLGDAVRALVPLGYEILRADASFSKILLLDHAYIATLVAAFKHGVRLRPELGAGETLKEIEGPSPGTPPSGVELLQLLTAKCPERLMQAIAETIKQRRLALDLEALAIATVVEAPAHSAKLAKLPALPGIAETDEEKLTICRAWIRCWSKGRGLGIWFSDMPLKWWSTEVGGSVNCSFNAMDRVLLTPQSKKAFKKDWIPALKLALTELMPGGTHRILASKLALDVGGHWRRCKQCRSVHRPVGKVTTCIDCGSADIADFDPDADEVYRARRGFYRLPIANALASQDPQIVTIIAAEHTAQIGTAQPEKAFSLAENHEIRFQDVDVAWRDTERPGKPAIDVLSSTTTMEVGIDIGELSGVALRNMPPARANYQQRAGRAGRRANAVATVVAFGSADSHDEHYFSKPEEMIRGEVIDPRLTLENKEIARRHVRAFLLQRYHEDRIPGVFPGPDSSLFSVLGKVGDFKTKGSILNRYDFRKWLQDEKASLVEALERWLPTQLSPSDKAEIVSTMEADVTKAIDDAIDWVQSEEEKDDDEEANDEASADHAGDDESDDHELDSSSDADQRVVDPSKDKLLDRLLYRGVVPRYAFPTDVVGFYVFNTDLSTAFRPVIEYQPSQGLSLALSQYAPNKQLWINNKQYTSKAIYSPYKGERSTAWEKRRLYFECQRCHHARTEDFNRDRIDTTSDCPACGAKSLFGPARIWFRPVGFAHPIEVPPETEPDTQNETARATRAKLQMQAPTASKGLPVTKRVVGFKERQFLLVSNTGIEAEGYDYCTSCGRVESTAAPQELLSQPHARPYRSDEAGPCAGGAFTKRHIVLGTDFLTDIALFSLPLTDGFQLPPANAETESALRTACEALAKAASQTLDIEPTEILAEFRPALTEAGAAGKEVEIFLYDTLAGGAGFSNQVVDRASEVFERALELLGACPEGCDGSCYRCLRSFRNRMEHAKLDRHLGIQFLQHTLNGGYPEYPADRVNQSLNLLHADLVRQFGDLVSFERDVYRKSAVGKSIKIPILARRLSTGAETWIALSSPIAPDIPVDAHLRALSGADADKLCCADDLVVRRHLPEASLRVFDALR